MAGEDPDQRVDQLQRRVQALERHVEELLQVVRSPPPLTARVDRLVGDVEELCDQVANPSPCPGARQPGLGEDPAAPSSARREAFGAAALSTCWWVAYLASLFAAVYVAGYLYAAMFGP